MRWALALVAGLQAVDHSATASPQRGGLPIYPIEPASDLAAARFGFLDSVLAGVEVVSLGESIHMTHEFPLVRIGMIRHLNERLGFHVLGMEGGPEDIWVAQDRFLHSVKSEADAEAAMLGLVGVWNTPEVKRLLEYEAASWRTGTPLYLTAYDVQPGIGRGSPGVEAFRQLADRLRSYVAPEAGFDIAAWVSDLAPVADQCRRFQLADRGRVEGAIAALDRWVQHAKPAVERAFPAVPHALVLSLIPDNLRASLRLCETLGGIDWAHYKGRRDAQAAPYALELKSRLPQQKLMLWAHLDHVYYNHEQFPILTPAVGELLRKSLGERLYTIIPLAESGGAILVKVDPTVREIASGATPDADFGYARVHGARGELGQYLSTLGTGNYFLDVRRVDPGSRAGALLSREQPVWIESSSWQITPALDFDAIVWIKRVHAPDWPPTRLLMLVAIGYRKWLVPCGAILLLGIAGWALARRRQRRRA
jgi:erythromycin esterase-like protein